MASIKNIISEYDIAASVYIDGAILEMHSLTVRGNKNRANAVAVLMGQVMDATSAYPDSRVTAAISVGLFKKSLVFDGRVWLYV